MTRAGSCIAITIALTAPLAWFLYQRGGPSASDREITSRRFIEPENCRPEPSERAAFLASVLLLPPLIFVVTALAGLIQGRWPRWIEEASAFAMTGIVMISCIVCLRSESHYSLRLNEFFRHPTPSIYLIAATTALLIWGRARGRFVRALTGAAAAACLLVMASLRVFDERSSYVWTRSPFGWGDHFSAVYHPIVQAVLGKTILVDQASQYGLYPHFLEPIFALIGPSVLGFSTVMAALTAVVLAMTWAFVREAVENRVAALIGFLAMIANGSFVLIEMKDVYFQYMPIRTLFPAASTWLCGRYLDRPSRRKYATTMIVLALGILWNLDAGVPAMASWLGALCYREMAEGGSRRRLAGMGGHLFAGLLAIASALAAYSAFALIRTGRLPDFAAFFAYQRMFYISGFYMLPMPLLGGWCIVAMIYLAGLAYAARRMVEARITPRSSRILQLSLLGIGLLAYYQGRSHRSVLTLVWWPSVLLLTLFLDDLLATPRRASGRVARVAWTALLTWVLAGSAWSLISFPRFLKNWQTEHLFAAMKPGPSSVDEEVERLRSVIRSGDRLLMISRDEAVFNARLGVPSAWRTSLAEAILVDDFREMSRRIERGEFDRIYIDRSVLDSRFSIRPGFADLARVVERFPKTESTRRGILIDARSLTARRPAPDGRR